MLCSFTAMNSAVNMLSRSLSSMGLFLYREILCYPTPINFNYWYGIGLLLVFLLVNQVLTGIQVGSYYIVSIDVALSSVDYLMREITYGWSFRYLHSNGGTALTPVSTGLFH